MSKLKHLLTWLDDNLLLVLAGFLLAFIPLWPKIPVWSPIEQYIVRVRLEDFFLLFTAVVWIIQVLRKKVRFISPMFWCVLAYAVVGLASTVSAIFITKQIPLQVLHIEKSFLHYFRYLEYFSFFFIVYSSIKRRRDTWLLAAVLALTVIGVSIYGYGQKFFYWPVYSTMNREFSKGVRLVLTPHARVQSTFAGHYDMAAFLVIVLPILLALAYQVKDRRWKILFQTAFWFGTWLIIVSASRTSFVAYVGAIGLMILLAALYRDTFKQKIGFWLSRMFLVFAVMSVLYVYFGEDLNDRLTQIIDSNPKWHDTYHTLNKERKDLFASISSFSLLNVIPKPEAPKDAITTDQAVAMGILTPSDERPIPANPTPVPTANPNVPKDVYVTVPDIQKVSTVSATGVVSTIEVNKGPRIFSANAIKYGLSLGIRLDTLWPRAIQGFMINPLLGKGYATLNKESVDQFTEAESTDNNFLRTLGETGGLGFLTFYGCVAVTLYYSVRSMKTTDPLKRAIGMGLLCGTIGLLLNAVYIDVFASSKVALTFWGVSGVLLGFFIEQKPKSLAIIEEPPIEVKKKRAPSKRRTKVVHGAN